MASCRRLALVLLAMLARPWIWLMLAVWVLWPVLSLLSLLLNVMTPSATLTPVAIVSGPTVPPNGGADVREDRLATITDWHALWARVFVAAPGGGYTLVEADRDRSERLGDWDILDRLPALERLWMTAPDVLSETGWRRIGDRARLELLSLQNVGTCYAVGDDGFARDGREALSRLTRLQHLELRGTGLDAGMLLPPLPALEACGIGWRHLEENLTTLAAGSPRLHSLALETFPEFQFTPGMLAALRQMPALRTVFIAAAVQPEEEPAMARQVAELGRAVPKVRVRPGSYSTKRVRAVGSATFALAGICWVLWFQAATLLSTPLAWMLPRRFPPHAVWPTAVAAAGSAAFFILCQSFGVAWLPALGLALFAVGVGMLWAGLRRHARMARSAHVAGDRRRLRRRPADWWHVHGSADYGRPLVDGVRTGGSRCPRRRGGRRARLEDRSGRTATADPGGRGSGGRGRVEHGRRPACVADRPCRPEVVDARCADRQATDSSAADSDLRCGRVRRHAPAAAVAADGSAERRGRDRPWHAGWVGRDQL